MEGLRAAWRGRERKEGRETWMGREPGHNGPRVTAALPTGGVCKASGPDVARMGLLNQAPVG